MTGIVETGTWADEVYQIETTDPVMGGPDGIDNLPHRQLAARTRFLKALVEEVAGRLTEKLIDASETARGLIELATIAEAVAGTDAERAVTPAGLKAAITALVNGAPGALDTLNELATALGDDANFAASVTAALALKAPLDSPVLTGNPIAPTPAQFDSDTSLSTTAFVQRALGNNRGVIGLSANTTLTANHIGMAINLSNQNPFAVTLPQPVGLPDGAAMDIVNTAAGTVTIVSPGTNMLVSGYGYTPSFVVRVGDTARIVLIGGKWTLAGGRLGSAGLCR